MQQHEQDMVLTAQDALRWLWKNTQSPTVRRQIEGIASVLEETAGALEEADRSNAEGTQQDWRDLILSY